MEKRKSPNAFIVVLPGEIIEIPQNSDKSWLTLFYSLPRELAEKWKPAYDLPRCPYEVLRMDKYDHIVCDDMCNPLMIWQQRKAETDGLDAYKARNIYYHSIFDDLVKINNRIIVDEPTLRRGLNGCVPV